MPKCLVAEVSGSLIYHLEQALHVDPDVDVFCLAETTQLKCGLLGL